MEISDRELKRLAEQEMNAYMDRCLATMIQNLVEQVRPQIEDMVRKAVEGEVRMQVATRVKDQLDELMEALIDG